jgi:hypothetical protein
MSVVTTVRNFADLPVAYPDAVEIVVAMRPSVKRRQTIYHILGYLMHWIEETWISEVWARHQV